MPGAGRLAGLESKKPGEQAWEGLPEVQAGVSGTFSGFSVSSMYW